MAQFLPVEMVSYIMRYLSVSDRREAALVCRQWYEASLDPALQKDAMFDLHAAINNDDSIRYILQRKGLHLALENLDGFTHGKAALLDRCKEIGENLRELSLKASEVSETVLITILSHCYNLHSLDLCGCNSLFMSGQFLSKESDILKLKSVLKNLQLLSLANIRFLSDVTFNRVTQICTNLQKLSLAGCHILFHSSSYFGSSSKENSSVLTFETIHNYLKEHTETITALNFSRTALSNDALETVGKIPGLQLKELQIIGCKELSDKGIDAFCKAQSCIEKLDLSLNVELTDSSLYSISEHSQNLKYLNVAKCRQLTHMGMSRLASLKKLSYLDASSCMMILSKGLEKGICTPYTVSLQHLNLCGCTKVDDDFISKLCISAVNLFYLDLSSCVKVTDNSILDIARNLKYLRVLRFGWCREITDCGLLGIKRDAKSVRRPPIVQHEDGECYCKKTNTVSNIFNKVQKRIHDHGLEQQDTQYNLSNLAALIELDLSACHQITDHSLIEILKFKELRVLKLGMCPKITDDTLVTISKHEPSLEDLSLSQCSGVTDYGLDLVAKRLPRLTNLNVQNCEKITNRTVESLYVHATRLKHINLSMCCNITAAAADQLEARKPNPVQVNKRLLQ